MSMKKSNYPKAVQSQPSQRSSPLWFWFVFCSCHWQKRCGMCCKHACDRRSQRSLICFYQCHVAVLHWKALLSNKKRRKWKWGDKAWLIPSTHHRILLSCKLKKLNMKRELVIRRVGMSISYFNSIPLTDVPIGTLIWKHRLTKPILSVRSSSDVMSAI